MILFPTSLFGLSYFWWWQKKVKVGEEGQAGDESVVVKPSKNLVSEEKVTIVKQENTFLHEDSKQPLDEEDKLDDSLSLQEYQHASVKRKREHSSCDSAFVEDFISDNVSSTGSDVNSNKTSSTVEIPESPISHNETPEVALENEMVCEELIAPEVSENVESAPSNLSLIHI